MSELKEYLCVEAFIPYTKEIPGYLFKCAKYRAPQAEMELVYLKSEADKVIVEKDAEIVELKKQVHDYAQGLYVIQARADKDARHQKWKRCLAIAWWCSAELGMLVSTWESKIKYYKRWHKRWLELAEKFKEAK